MNTLDSALRGEGYRDAVVCVHHWIIDAPEGPVSRGMCKKCGEERDFSNYLEHPGQWQENVSLDQVTTGAYFHIGEAVSGSIDAWEE